MIRVSFQGERGAYSEAAAKSFFDDNIQTIPLPTFSEILQNTSKGISEFSILPVENSLEGSVGESYDLLYSTDLNVTGETYQKIEHCLIGIGELEEIDTVYSHPQALGQCRQFIEKYKMKTIPTYDTAGSVKIIKELKEKWTTVFFNTHILSDVQEIADRFSMINKWKIIYTWNVDEVKWSLEEFFVQKIKEDTKEIEIK